MPLDPILALEKAPLFYLQRVLFWATKIGTGNDDTWPLMQIRNPIWADSLGGNNRSSSLCE